MLRLTIIIDITPVPKQLGNSAGLQPCDIYMHILAFML